MKIQRHIMMACQHNRARNRIRNVVMRAGSVINGILAAARRPALKAVKLGYQPAIIEQLTLARIEQRQSVAVNVALHPLGRNIVNIALLELFARPLTARIDRRSPSDAVSRQRLQKSSTTPPAETAPGPRERNPTRRHHQFMMRNRQCHRSELPPVGSTNAT